MKRQTELGKKAQQIMEAGELVPDSLVDEIVKTRLEAPDTAAGFILDGYPRTTGQAEFFEKLAVQESIQILAVGVIVADDVLVQRLSRRWNCPQCGKIYNFASDAGNEARHCDECGGVLTQRKDDKPEVIRERLAVYHKTTQPLIDLYRQRGQYREVDGEGSVDLIYASILKIVKPQV